MASLLEDSVARRLAVLTCIAQIVLTWILPVPRAQLDLCAYPIYLLLSIVATELMVTVGVWRRLRWAFFFLVLVLYVVIAYHFGWYHYLLFIKTMGRSNCFCVLGKTAIFVGSMGMFAPMCVNILVCFLTVFLGY